MTYFFGGLLFFYFLMRIESKVIGLNNVYIVLVINILTTLLHELSHYIVAFFLGARPTGFSLIPKKRQIGEFIYWEFGSVQAYTNRFNAFFIGIAPVLNIVFAYFIWKYYFLYMDFNLFNVMFLFFIEWVLIINGVPSRQDLKVAISGYIGWIFSIFIILGYLLLK